MKITKSNINTIEVLRENPFLISFIEYTYCLQYINNMSYIIKKEAVEKDYTLISTIENPSEELQLIVVRNPTVTLHLIKNPTLRVKVEAIKFNIKNIEFTNGTIRENDLSEIIDDIDPSILIKYISNPSEELQLKALRYNIYSLDNSKITSYTVQREIVKLNPHYIRNITNPSEELQLIAVLGDANTIYDIDLPSREVQELALRKKCRLRSCKFDNDILIDYILTPEIDFSNDLISKEIDDRCLDILELVYIYEVDVALKIIYRFSHLKSKLLHGINEQIQLDLVTIDDSYIKFLSRPYCPVVTHCLNKNFDNIRYIDISCNLNRCTLREFINKSKEDDSILLTTSINNILKSDIWSL